MRKVLVVLYVVSSLAEIVGSLMLAVGFWGGDPKWLIGGIDIAIFAIALNEGMKYFCRTTDERFDAYVAAFGDPPLHGLSFHRLRAFVRGYRLQEVR